MDRDEALEILDTVITRDGSEISLEGLTIRQAHALILQHMYEDGEGFRGKWVFDESGFDWAIAQTLVDSGKISAYTDRWGEVVPNFDEFFDVMRGVLKHL